jgi:hypothetical protein
MSELNEQKGEDNPGKKMEFNDCVEPSDIEVDLLSGN